jgi:hypothetical protein
MLPFINLKNNPNRMGLTALSALPPLDSSRAILLQILPGTPSMLGTGAHFIFMPFEFSRKKMGVKLFKKKKN